MCRCKLTLRVGKADGQSAGLGLTLADIGGGIPHPAAVRANVGGKLHLGHNYDEHGQIRLPLEQRFCEGAVPSSFVSSYHGDQGT